MYQQEQLPSRHPVKVTGSRSCAVGPGEAPADGAGFMEITSANIVFLLFHLSRGQRIDKLGKRPGGRTRAHHVTSGDEVDHGICEGVGCARSTRVRTWHEARQQRACVDTRWLPAVAHPPATPGPNLLLRARPCVATMRNYVVALGRAAPCPTGIHVYSQGYRGFESLPLRSNVPPGGTRHRVDEAAPEAARAIVREGSAATSPYP